MRVDLIMQGVIKASGQTFATAQGSFQGKLSRDHNTITTADPGSNLPLGSLIVAQDSGKRYMLIDTSTNLGLAKLHVLQAGHVLVLPDGSTIAARLETIKQLQPSGSAARAGYTPQAISVFAIQAETGLAVGDLLTTPSGEQLRVTRLDLTATGLVRLEVVVGKWEVEQ